MTSKELQKIINKLCKEGEMKFLDATTEEKIVLFEKMNDIKFPIKYKEWLLFSDGGELFLPIGIQFYGIEHEPIINVDDRLYDDYIVIGVLASGDSIVFKNTEEIISIYNLEGGRIENDETYEDFYTFLSDMYDILGIGD